MFREGLCTGVLKGGSYILNVSTGDKQRIGRLVRMFADKREEIEVIGPGDIGAVVGLKNTFTGHSLSDINQPLLLESIEFADPPVSIAIEPATKADQEKMSLALQRLAEEDPTFRVSVDEETNQTIVSAMGELYLEVIVDRLKQEFKVSANVGKPQVAYRETIKKQRRRSPRQIYPSIRRSRAVRRRLAAPRRPTGWRRF